MEINEYNVKQYHYDGFGEHSEIKNAVMTKWSNGEGMDVYIARENLPDITIALTWSDISLLRRIFSDFEN